MTTRTKAALFDMSYFGQIFIAGSDAQKAADWLFTANMQKDAGNVVYTCMLNQQGGTEADLTVVIFLFFTLKPQLIMHIRDYIIKLNIRKMLYVNEN